MTSEIATQLESLVDSPNVMIPWDNLDLYWKNSLENAISSHIYPDYLISPPDVETLSKIVQYAKENQWSILPCGNGTKLHWGGLISSPKLVISTQNLNRIIDHAVGDLTVTVEAGVKLRDLQRTLRQVNQFLPIDPTYPDDATIGGIVATADTGSWRQRYGGIRDLVLGLSFVRSDGKIAKGGGRVVKNVAGYDLMKLFTGSYGTLGIISQVTFRTYPYPDASGTLGITGDQTAIATATQTLLKSGLQPTAAEILSASVVQKLDLGKGMGLMVRFQSISESVKEQIDQVSAIAQQLGLNTAFYEGEIEESLWQQLQDFIRVPYTKSASTCKIGIMPNQGVNFLNQLDELTHNQGWGMININSGIGKLQLEMEPSLGILKQLRSLVQSYQGFLTILESPKSLKKQIEPWGYKGNALPVMDKLKQQFDPNNIFSPDQFSTKF